MTTAEALDRLDAIRKISGDDERAHAEEDRLRHDVLRAIADGHDSPRTLAVIALRTSEVKFARWYA